MTRDDVHQALHRASRPLTVAEIVRRSGWCRTAVYRVLRDVAEPSGTLPGAHPGAGRPPTLWRPHKLRTAPNKDATADGSADKGLVSGDGARRLTRSHR